MNLFLKHYRVGIEVMAVVVRNLIHHTEKIEVKTLAQKIVALFSSKNAAITESLQNPFHSCRHILSRNNEIIFLIVSSNPGFTKATWSHL